MQTDATDQSEEDWKKQLTPEQYRVLRQHGTERAGTSKLNAEKRPGRFVCAGCGAELFDSGTKYESGSGWPSFWAPLEDSVETTTDRSLFMTPYRGALPYLPGPSRPCLRGWAQADRPALLHERRRADLQAEGRCLRRRLPGCDHAGLRAAFLLPT